MDGDAATFFDPWEHVDIHGSKLPHWQQPGATYFVTFRLADSLPKSLLDQWKNDRENWLQIHPRPWNEQSEAEYHQLFSTKIDEWLDHGHGECLLQFSRNRRALAEVLRNYDENRYLLHSWIIMPNHVHVLFSLAEKVRLEATLKSWKGISAREINRLRSAAGGKLWMKGYFDRIIRDADHFRKVIRYIRKNPDKANLKQGSFTRYETTSVTKLLDC